MSGLIKIPSGSCEILVLRPIDNSCRQGSQFDNGVYYDEDNSLTLNEDSVHQYLLRKQMFFDLAKVEKDPSVQVSVPKKKKKLFKGTPANLPKVDPLDVTMSKKNKTMKDLGVSQHQILDEGTAKVEKRYSNSGNLSRESPVHNFDQRIFDPIASVSGSAMKVNGILDARSDRARYANKFGQIRNHMDSSVVRSKEQEYDDYIKGAGYEDRRFVREGNLQQNQQMSYGGQMMYSQIDNYSNQNEQRQQNKYDHQIGYNPQVINTIPAYSNQLKNQHQFYRDQNQVPNNYNKVNIVPTQNHSQSYPKSDSNALSFYQRLKQANINNNNSIQ